MVHPWGVEPQSSEPESDILSIELRVRSFLNAGQRYNELLATPNISPTFFDRTTQSYHFILKYIQFDNILRQGYCIITKYTYLCRRI